MRFVFSQWFSRGVRLLSVIRSCECLRALPCKPRFFRGFFFLLRAVAMTCGDMCSAFCSVFWSERAFEVGLANLEVVFCGYLRGVAEPSRDDVGLETRRAAPSPGLSGDSETVAAISSRRPVDDALKLSAKVLSRVPATDKDRIFRLWTGQRVQILEIGSEIREQWQLAD